LQSGTHYDGQIIEGEWADEVPEDFVEDYRNHDLVICVPVPKFKMPVPPTEEEEFYGGEDFY